jgi:hypothetical protein
MLIFNLYIYYTHKWQPPFHFPYPADSNFFLFNFNFNLALRFYYARETDKISRQHFRSIMVTTDKLIHICHA